MDLNAVGPVRLHSKSFPLAIGLGDLQEGCGRGRDQDDLSPKITGRHLQHPPHAFDAAACLMAVHDVDDLPAPPDSQTPAWRPGTDEVLFASTPHDPDIEARTREEIEFRASGLRTSTSAPASKSPSTPVTPLGSRLLPRCRKKLTTLSISSRVAAAVEAMTGLSARAIRSR